jgi:hypothetical protein
VRFTGCKSSSSVVGIARRHLSVLVVAFFGLFAPVPAALADGTPSWLPHPADATWEYTWTDSVYNTTPTKEKVTVKTTTATSFTLAWTTDGENNPSDAPTSTGTVDFQESQYGLINTNWASNQPPANFPTLCASLTSCGNSLASTYYNVIWGTRAPTLWEPLLKGTAWAATGAAKNDVSSTNTYLGTELVTVPAFPQPVLAAKVQSQITQAGALGDPYGSGIRTVWWVYGVGPVKVEFDHAGGADAPVTTSVLDSTNQTALPPPPDTDWFPLRKGLHGRYQWTNTKHLPKPEVQKVSIDQVANGSAQISVNSISGPIKEQGQYGFTQRLDGVTNLWGVTKSASLATFPPLGPKSLPPAKRRHFATVFDLMTFGFNPLITATPEAGNTWQGGKNLNDFATYGVTGQTTVLGIQKVKVPAGTFQALAVRSVLEQPGFPFGSGTRTMWFAAGRGLVKLVFRHGDHSVSTVVLLK